MNWLHACWGLGAFTGPMLMTRAIVDTGSWRNGYLAVSLIQLTLSVIFLLSLPLWKHHQKAQHNVIKAAEPAKKATSVPSEKLTVKKRLRRSLSYVVHKKGLLAGMLLFLFYVGSETSVGIWSASYLRTARAVSIEDAGIWVSMFYGSITVGRVITGFFVEKIGTRKSIWIGITVSVIGFISLSLPFATNILCPLGLILIGLGFAPVYPCTMQDAPIFFGSFSVIAIGYEMGCANLGYAFLPMTVGAVSGATTLYAVPLIAFLFLVGFAVSYSRLSRAKAED
jgi:fucose permease